MAKQTKAAANFLKGLAKQVREFESAHGGPEAVSLRLAEDDSGGEGAARVILRVQRLVTEGADAAVEAQVLVSITYNVRGALFDAPVVRFLTENNVFKVGPPVCMHGVTHYHPESFDRAMSLAAIADSIATILLEDGPREDLSEAVGACEPIRAGLPEGTLERNLARHGDLLALWDGERCSL